MRCSVLPAGWMKITAPTCSALAQNGRSRCVAELDAVHVRRDDDAAQIEIAHAALELRRRQRDVVQRQRAEPDQPVRMLRHRFGDPIIAETIHVEGVVRLHPVGALLHDAGADHLDVDAGRVHLLEPQRQLRSCACSSGSGTPPGPATAREYCDWS